MPTTSSEQWRDVPGSDGRYEVSDLGGVRSWVQTGPGRVRRKQPRPLKPHDNGNGYLSVMMGANRRDYIHRLVMAAFVGPGEGLDVDHVNRDRSDNRLVNLQYLTHAENMRKQRADGVCREGQNNPAYTHGRNVGNWARRRAERAA